MRNLIIFCGLILLAIATPEKDHACKCQYCDLNMISETDCAADCFPDYCENKLCDACDFCASLDCDTAGCPPSNTGPTPTPTNYPLDSASATGWKYGVKDPNVNADGFTESLTYSASISGGTEYRPSAGAYPVVAFLQPNNVILMHPGEGGERATLRFTAPAASTATCFTFKFKVWGASSGTPASVDIAVTNSNGVVFSKNVVGTDPGSVPDDATVPPMLVYIPLTAGGIVDLSCGKGTNDYTYDSNKWQVQATEGCPAISAFPSVHTVGSDWTFGELDRTGTFTKFQTFDHKYGRYGWLGTRPDGFPLVLQESDSTLVLHTANDIDQRSSARFTAPESKCYVFSYKFWAADDSGTADASVTKGTEVLWASAIYGPKPATYPPTERQQICINLLEDATIDFSTGFGFNGGYSNDAVGLAVSVSDDCPRKCKFMFYHP